MEEESAGPQSVRRVKGQGESEPGALLAPEGGVVRLCPTQAQCLSGCRCSQREQWAQAGPGGCLGLGMPSRILERGACCPRCDSAQGWAWCHRPERAHRAQEMADGGRPNRGEMGLGMRHATTSCWLGSCRQVPFAL